MKYILSVFCIFSLLYLFSCGNDTTTNNNNSGNGETVILSLDSLSITLNTMFGIIDSNIVINNAPKIKITFNCSTNSDSTNSVSLFQIKAYDSLRIYKDTLNNNISSLNNFYTISIDASNNFILMFYLQINGNSPYYIRLKNIKIAKIS